jgi:hypothetical protein
VGPVEATAEQRRPEVRAAARWLDISPGVASGDGVAAGVAQLYATAAMNLLYSVGVDTPELTTALRDLTVAKDSAVRAALAGRP